MASLSRTLLVVCPEGPALRVFTCIARLRGWSLGRVDIVQVASGELQSGAQSDLLPGVQPALQPEAITAAVRPLVLRWGIPPGTEVALVLPAVTGGMLTLTDQPRGPGASVDRAWLERELAERVPFAFKDIDCEAQAHGAGKDRSIQVAWLPRTVAIEFRTAFARLGLSVGEIVFRSQLFAAWPAAAGRNPRVGHTDPMVRPGVRSGVRPGERPGELVIEHFGGACSFHVLAGGRVLRTSMAQTPTSRKFADRLRLELLSIASKVGREDQVAPAVASTGVSRIVLAGAQDRFDSEFETAARDAAGGIEIERRATEISTLFVRFWRTGGTGIWLVPENPAPLAMARRLAFAIAGIGALLAAAMGWDVSAIREEIAALEARETRLRPQYQALTAKQRQAASAGATADAVARLSASPSEPQAALLAVFNALPRSAWVTRYAFEAGKATVAGKGIDTESVIAKLQGQPGVSRITAAPGDEPEASDGDAGQRFRVWFQWAPTEPGRSPGQENADAAKQGPR